MRVGILTGSGTYALPGFESGQGVLITTPYGDVEVSEGRWHGVDVVHIARHGSGHARLSNTVNHRANVWAMRERGASCVIGLTACGAVDPDLELGSVVIFDDLYFISNRLPDGYALHVLRPGRRSAARPLGAAWRTVFRAARRSVDHSGA